MAFCNERGKCEQMVRIGRDQVGGQWLIPSLSPAGGENISKPAVGGGDITGLSERPAQVRKKVQARTGKVFPLS